MFINIDKMRLRIDGCVFLRKDGEPGTCTTANMDTVSFRGFFGNTEYVPLSDILLECPPTGLVNLPKSKSAAMFKRVPAQQYRIGHCPSNTRLTSVSGVPITFPPDFWYSVGFRHMLMNSYPKAASVQKLLSDGWSSVAINRKDSIQYSEEYGLYSLSHNNELVKVSKSLQEILDANP